MPGKKNKKAKKISWIKKFGLESQAFPTQISEETKAEVRALLMHSRAAIKAGEAEVKLNKTKYR